MKMMSLISDENPDTVSIQLEFSDKRMERKDISFSEYLSMLEVSTKMDDYLSLELPDGYYKGKISLTNPSTFKVMVIVPGGVRPLIYMDTTYFIPYPDMLFHFQIERGKTLESKCFALRTTRPEKKDYLYHFPFGNVYDNGNICWGGNVLEKIKDIKDINHVVALFYGSPTNNDLFRSEHLNNGKKYAQSLRILYEELKDKKKFPEKLLKKYIRVCDLEI